jgi:bifunctional enzyme CysN/CysC/sulfate adenylyltransferase subunit 1
LGGVDLIPISALAGDNVVDRTVAMPWYTGATLLEYLENIPLHTADPESEPLRFPVQLVVRPDAAFRGFAGRVERGELRVGQTVRALPSGRMTRVSRIVTYDGDLKAAHSPQSVTVTLEDEIDLSRGEMLIDAGVSSPATSTTLHANVVWMNEQPLLEGHTFILKHTTRTVRATIRSIRHRFDIVTTQQHHTRELEMNDIAEVELQTNLPLFVDSYEANHPLGSFILIHPINNATVAAGMITASADARGESIGSSEADPAFAWIRGDDATATRVANVFQQRDQLVVNVDDPLIPEPTLPAVARALQLARVSAVTTRPHLQPIVLDALKKIAGDAWIEDEADLHRFLEEHQ